MAGLKDTEAKLKLLKIKEEEFGLKTSYLFAGPKKIIRGTKESCPPKILTKFIEKK